MEKYLEVSVMFLFTALVSVLMLIGWSYTFTGDILRVNFQNELPNALIFAAVTALLLFVWRNAPPGKERMLLLIGLGLIVLEVFVEMPMKKFVVVHPALAPDITSWFFLFGLAEFIGLMCVFTGFVTLSKQYTKK